MMIQNVSYGFVPPGGSASIRVMGAQEYSPGQTRKNDIWLIAVPEEYSGRMPVLGKGESYSSYGECLRILAGAFFEGDVSKVELTPGYGDAP